jgi:hypothetical protein
MFSKHAGHSQMSPLVRLMVMYDSKQLPHSVLKENMKD